MNPLPIYLGRPRATWRPFI